MTTRTCSLPGITLRSALPRTPLSVNLPRLVRVEREGNVLQPSIMREDGEVLSLNLARGCVQRCVFCSVRAYPTYPGDQVFQLFANTAELLEEELAHRRCLPQAVFISPSTDPFPPITEVQDQTGRVVEVLARHEISAWLMTRGFIRPAALEVLTRHREFVQVTMGLTTVDRPLQRVLEPLTAPPALRLQQIAELRRRGIAVRVSIEPLVPGLTDTRENLIALLQGLAQVGIRHITASYMFLRPGIADNLVRSLAPYGWDESILEEFAGGPILSGNGVAAARYLPKARRQRGYAALMALAATFDITVSVCGMTNPDFAVPPPRQPIPVVPQQRLLPLFMEWSKQAHSV